MIRLTSLLFIFSYATFISAQDTWIMLDSVNGPPRGSCASFELEGEGYVVSGLNHDGFKRKMYSYSLKKDDWDDELSLGGESGSGLNRGSAIGFSADGYGFIGLGTGNAPYFKDLWRYEARTKTWTQMADFPGSARRAAVAFSIDRFAYVGTGQSFYGAEKDFYKYEPATNTWSSLADFPGGPRREAVGFTMGGKGYFGTGTDNSFYKKDFWEYDPTSDTWTQKADFPSTPRIGAVGCGVFPSAFIALGEDNGANYKKDVWEYHYFGDVWSQKSDYPGGTRTEATAFIVDERVFIGLGYNGVYHDDFYEYEVVLGIRENQRLKNVAVFPNPSNGSFQVKLNENENGEYSFLIFDINGKDMRENFQINFENNTYFIETKKELVGQFLLTVINNDKIISTKKIVLQ